MIVDIKEPFCANPRCEFNKIECCRGVDYIRTLVEVDEYTMKSKNIERRRHCHSETGLHIYSTCIFLCENCSVDNVIAKRILGVEDEE